MGRAHVDYHTTAVGKVLVAYGAAELPAGRLRRVAEGTIIDRALLEAEFERVRATRSRPRSTSSSRG